MPDQELVGVRAIDIGSVDNVPPESTMWRSNEIPPSWSGYSPQTWSPVNCMAPKPIRPTVRSPPTVIVPMLGLERIDLSS